MGAKAKAIEQELADFKVRVREEALRVRRNQGWRQSSMLETLTRLGLNEGAPEATSIPQEGDSVRGLSEEWYVPYSHNWCGRRHRPTGYQCSRPHGHAGDTHVASTSLQVMRVWDTGSAADGG
jgi:hypothetical protein